MIGVLDPSTGVTQKDVENDLLCKGNSFIEPPVWPFENIAIFHVNKSSRRSSGGCVGSRHRSDRVFDKPRKLNSSAKAFNQMVDSGFFQSLEWDAVVQLASADIPSMTNSVHSGLLETFAP